MGYGYGYKVSGKVAEKRILTEILFCAHVELESMGDGDRTSFQKVGNRTLTATKTGHLVGNFWNDLHVYDIGAVM